MPPSSHPLLLSILCDAPHLPQCLLAASDFQHELGIHVVEGDLQAVEVRLPKQAGEVVCDEPVRTRLSGLLRKAAGAGKSAPLGNKIKVYEPKEGRTLKIAEPGAAQAYLGQKAHAAAAKEDGRELTEEEKAKQQPQGLMAYAPYVMPALVIYMCLSRFTDDASGGKGKPATK